MKALVFQGPGKPLALEKRDIPNPEPTQVRIKVQTCGVCRTDPHLIDGELPNPKTPVILGHQIVGTVNQIGSKPVLALESLILLTPKKSEARPYHQIDLPNKHLPNRHNPAALTYPQSL